MRHTLLALFCMLMNSAIIRVGFWQEVGLGQTAHSFLDYFFTMCVCVHKCESFRVGMHVCLCEGVVGGVGVTQNNSFG